MHKTVFAAAAAVAIFSGGASGSTVLADGGVGGRSASPPEPPEVVANSHLIFLKPRSDEAGFKAWVQRAAGELGAGGGGGGDEGAGVANIRVEGPGSAAVPPAVAKEFKLGAAAADQLVIAGTFDDRFVAEARARPEVAGVFPNLVHRILGVQRDPPNAGLPEISSRSPRGARDYFFPDSAGQGVTVYIIDTGIRATHNDFGGRATLGFTAVDGTADANDDNGHGTHVGGIVGGRDHGVAKGVNLVAVKVCSSEGRCTTQDIVEGISFVIGDARRRGGPGKSVANLSIGGPADRALDQAVQSAIDSGVAFAVAAGNSDGDACDFSPSRIRAAVTVGALDSDGASKAGFSNAGGCVDVFAPGVAIRSDSINGDDGTAVLSGTSMSSPFAAGVMALFAGQGDFTVRELADAVTNMATRGEIRNLQDGTPNLILFNGGESGVAPEIPPSQPTPSATVPTEPEVPTPTNSESPTPSVPAKPKPRPIRRPPPKCKLRPLRRPHPIRFRTRPVYRPPHVPWPVRYGEATEPDHRWRGCSPGRGDKHDKVRCD